MKKQLLNLLFFFSVISSFAQKGWRTGEMEVKIFVNSNADANTLHDLHFTGDVHLNAGYALVYVTPSEFYKIKNTNLEYEILIDDLNTYSNDFWTKKMETYLSYSGIITLMDSLAQNFPNICKKTVLGTSGQGREISYLKISDNVSVHENEAGIAFEGGIHGDEVGAAENSIRFARYLCLSYGSNTQVTNLVNTREIFIYPMINPDGRANDSRYNGNFVDCNRDFGYMWAGEGNSPAPYSQIETKLVRNFIYNNQVSTHITYHSGVEEVIYPWCYRPDLAPDYAVFNDQATLYSSTSGYSYLPDLQSYADYPTTGELIDASYGSCGALSLTMEISNDKQPSDIQNYFQINVSPMIAMIDKVGYGLGGIITDSITGHPLQAAVFINTSFPVYSDSTVGDYHKYVLPGTYTIKVVANNYQTKTITGVSVSSGSSSVVNIQLSPAIGSSVYKVVTVVPDNNGGTANAGNTPAVIGLPDGNYYSLGSNGWMIVDMLQPVNNVTGNDFKVFEGDNTTEGYTCYASLSMDGPWTLLGTGTGTQEFDLSSLSQARYIKIVDDGIGNSSSSTAGFDFDAIGAIGQPLPTGISTNEISFKVFPNPARSSVVIENVNALEKYNLAISDVQGRVLLSRSVDSVISYKLDITGFDAGIYFLTLQSDKGIKTQKIVVEHT